MPANNELYDHLGINKNATPDEIKKAFRRKAMDCHPDKHAGDKDKEAEFKKINESYSILSDPQKRKMYDQFGIVNDQGGGGPGGPGGVDLSDILQGMFGGGIHGMHGMHGMPGMSAGPGGFSFVFMNGGDDDMDIPEDIMGNMFGGGGHRRPKPCDVITIPVDICDIYYGKVKKVEFELLDLCGKCNGTGASDPSFVIKCLTCDGKGTISHQVGPFFAQSVRCHSCAGSGSTIKNNKICQSCKGQKTVYTKKQFELKIPKGIPDNFEIRMEEKGAYEERIKKNKDILFKFKHNVHKPYELDQEGNVTYTLNIPIEDILAGFEKKITIYNEDHLIKSTHYINPNKDIIIENLGIFNPHRNKHMDFIIKIKPEFGDCERLVKYNDVICKILKKNKDESTSSQEGVKKVINLSG